MSSESLKFAGRARAQALQKALIASAEEMPEYAAYRQSVVATATYRLKVAAEFPDDEEAIEEAINMGQLEELIERTRRVFHSLSLSLSLSRTETFLSRHR